MARCYGLRFGLIGAALAFAVSITTASTVTSNYFEPSDGTATVTQGGPYVITLSADPRYDFALPAIEKRDAVARSFPSYRPAAERVRASGAAVRPTSVAGWRSGRVRHLAA